MKLLKRIGLGLIGLILLLAIIGLFLPSKIELDQSAELSATPEVVYAQIADFKQWNYWSPWHEMDTQMTIAYTGEPMTLGHGYSWKSEELGDGRIEITKLEPFSYIESDMYFMGDDNPATGIYALEATEKGTMMRWGIRFDMGWNPFGRLFGATLFPVFMNKDFKRGLEKMEAHVSQLPKTATPKIEEFQFEGNQFIAISFAGKPDFEQMENQMGEMFGELFGFLQANNMQASGPAFTYWHWWSDTLIRYQACVPVASLPKKLSGRIETGSIPAGLALRGDHFGEPAGTEDLHYAMDAYAVSKAYKLGDPLEILLTDPNTEPDRSKWHTQVIYPVKSE